MAISASAWRPSPGIQIEGKALRIVKSDSSMSILAGPGSGKTEILAQRAMFLLSTGLCPPPRRILALAFKVDAARNLSERVQERCEESESQRFESLTLHAFSKRILDQFREALPSHLRPSFDYTLITTTGDIWEEFREFLSAKFPTQAHRLQAFTNVELGRIVQSTVPDAEIEEEAQPEDVVRHEWWRRQIEMTPSRLTFDMVMSLAVQILNQNEAILKAVRATYSHVFLDEFQDVTGQQYDLIRAAFLGSSAILTAVGDSNQAIMKWAGARADIFERFEEDFAAERLPLQFNFRSNLKIVELINRLSLTIDTNSVKTECARKDAPVPANAIEGWVFDSRDSESEFLAKFIATELRNGTELRADDFVILARLRVNDIEDRLTGPFKTQGIRVRNEARQVSGIAIQDLVKDVVFEFLMASLKLAVNVRDGQPFQICRDFIATIRGIDINTDRGHKASWDFVRLLIDDLQASISNRVPGNVRGEELLELILNHVEIEEIRRGFREYRWGDWLKTILDGFKGFYDECSATALNWKDCIASIEGSDQVRLMTIHKSKGLEYHTVVFLEFNDDAFWGNDDDVNVFFVALSRARERVYFSFVRDSQGFINVREFIDSLKKADVQFVAKK